MNKEATENFRLLSSHGRHKVVDLHLSRTARNTLGLEKCFLD